MSAPAVPAATISITPIPLFTDNYSWLVVNAQTNECVVVDAADPSPCLAAVAASGARLAGLLTTHHHADHAGGNAALAAAQPGLAVVGGAAEGGRIPAATALVANGDAVELAGLRFVALHTPCHTRGHVCFHLPAARAVFTGDTLFAGGCGRFFEGDAPAMAASLAALAALPADTRVFCGHEYTLANLASFYRAARSAASNHPTLA